MQIHKAEEGMEEGDCKLSLVFKTFHRLKSCRIPALLSVERPEWKMCCENISRLSYHPLLGPNDLNAKRMEMQKYPRSFWLRANKSEKRWRAEFSW